MGSMRCIAWDVFVFFVEGDICVAFRGAAMFT